MTQLRLTLILLPLAACGDLGERAQTGDCPAGEVCSDGTPRGLHFDGATLGDSFLTFGPHPTLAGGTQHVRLTYDPGGGLLRALDRPYLADDDGGDGVRVDRTSGATVTLLGVADRTNYVRITDLDGALFDRKQFQGAMLSEIRIVPQRLEQILPGDGVVFAAGPQDLTVALFGRVQGGGTERAVDESLAITLPGATRSRWDTLRVDLPAGHHAMTVRAGDRPEAAIDVEVVAGADSIVAHAPEPALAAGGTSIICFSAHAAGRHVAGLTWTFATDNGAAQGWLTRNCAAVAPEREGALNLTARAGGQVLTASFTVGPASARVAASAPQPPSGTTAGERAAARTR